jgi:hypothetical protein
MSLISNRQHISKRSLLLLIFFTSILTIWIYSTFIRIPQYDINLSLNYTAKYPYLALIFDDRATQSLVNAVTNALQHIPHDWKVQIMTPNKHWSYYRNSSIGRFIKSKRVFLTPFKQSQNGSMTNEDINIILTSASFWWEVQGDHVLFFQTDSVLCSNSLYEITHFLQYDFIGAPWYIGGCCNGGLSLRNRTKILQMLESGHVHYRFDKMHEDGWFTKFLPYFNGRIAPISVAKQFAVETIYHPRPFAVHKPHISTMGSENMNRLCNECPELKTIDSYCLSATKVRPANN